MTASVDRAVKDQLERLVLDRVHEPAVQTALAEEFAELTDIVADEIELAEWRSRRARVTASVLDMLDDDEHGDLFPQEVALLHWLAVRRVHGSWRHLALRFNLLEPRMPDAATELALV